MLCQFVGFYHSTVAMACFRRENVSLDLLYINSNSFKEDFSEAKAEFSQNTFYLDVGLWLCSPSPADFMN